MKEKLLPTNAPVLFYDPLQQQFRQPREGKLTVSLCGKTLDCEWSSLTTTEIQEAIDTLTAEILKRALAGEDQGIDTFALKLGGLVSRLEDLTHVQREKIQQVAARSPHWPVNVTVRNSDFTWAKRYIRGLGVGSKSLLRALPGSTIRRHANAARLAEKLWLRLLENRDKLPEWIEAVGPENSRKLKTHWISRLLSLPTIEQMMQGLTTQDALELWELGEALLQEAWEKERQSAFGSILPEYHGRKSSRKTVAEVTDAEVRKDIFKRLRAAFLSLLGHVDLVRQSKE